MSLMESLQESINEPEKVPIGIGKEKDVEEKGEKEKNLEKYMEYVPDKREQEVRLMNMLKDQEKEEEVVINILDAFKLLYFKRQAYEQFHVIDLLINLFLDTK